MITIIIIFVNEILEHFYAGFVLSPSLYLVTALIDLVLLSTLAGILNR